LARQDKIGTLGSLNETDSFDVCIIGSGFAGTILGTLLSRQGARTLILESGTNLFRWVFDKKVEQLADYEVTGNADYLTKRTKGRLLGGNSNFWTGRCERFHASDFESHPYVPEDNPWPIRYSDMEPYYEAAERMLRVRGGPLSSYMPPRRGPLPQPPKTDISSVQGLYERIGVTVDYAPTATPRSAIRYFRVQNEILPEFLESPHGSVITGATVQKLEVDRDRNIVGAFVKTLSGVTKTVRAKIFVVCCGGIETPRLLLLSQSEEFPDGIGNDYDRVGRGFNEHPVSNFFGTLKHTAMTVIPRHKIGRIHQFYDEFRPAGLGGLDISVIQSWLFPNHLLPPAEIVRDFGRILRRVVRPSLYMAPIIEMDPTDSNRVSLSRHMKDSFGNPLAHLHLDFSDRDRKTLDLAKDKVRTLFDKLGASDIREGPLAWARHHQGTCRMGENPKTSVIDPNLRVHGTPNLYVLGAETFVTGAAVTPVLTISALAHRLADHIPAELRTI